MYKGYGCWSGLVEIRNAIIARFYFSVEEIPGKKLADFASENMSTFFMSKIFPMISLIRILKSGRRRQLRCSWAGEETSLWMKPSFKNATDSLWKILNNTNFLFASSSKAFYWANDIRHVSVVTLFLILVFLLPYVTFFEMPIDLLYYATYCTLVSTYKFQVIWVYLKMALILICEIFYMKYFSSTETISKSDKGEIRNFCLGPACWSVILDI